MNHLKFIFAILISITLVVACSKNNTNNQSSTTSESVKPEDEKFGSAGKHKFSYVEKNGQLAVLYLEKVNLDEIGNQTLEDGIYVALIAKTINTILGYDDISIDEITKYKVVDKEVVLKGKKCTYNVKLISDGNNLLGFGTNSCK